MNIFDLSQIRVKQIWRLQLGDWYYDVTPEKANENVLLCLLTKWTQSTSYTIWFRVMF